MDCVVAYAPRNDGIIREWEMRSLGMRNFFRVAVVALMSMLFACVGLAGEGKPHHLAIHVDQNDPLVMNQVLNNATNVIEYYRAKNEDVDVDRLFVTEAYVNEGPRMKRVRPAPMGRAYRYQRRLAHIVIKVAEKEA